MQEAKTQVIPRYIFVAIVKCPYCGKEQCIEVYEMDDCIIEQCTDCGKEIHLFLIMKTVVLKREECPQHREAIEIRILR